VAPLGDGFSLRKVKNSRSDFLDLCYYPLKSELLQQRLLSSACWILYTMLLRIMLVRTWINTDASRSGPSHNNF